MHIKLATLAATLVLPLGAAYASPPDNRPPDNRPPDKGCNNRCGGGGNNNNGNNQSQNQQQNQQQTQQQTQTACAEANVIKVGDITISILGSEPIVIEDDSEPCGD